MSLIPGEKLCYAETHFKFKLPWSLLFKPWPEILVDAPFQFIPGIEPILWIVVRDAHRFPTLIEKIDIDAIATDSEGTKSKSTKSIDLQIKATEQFGFYPVQIGALDAGRYEIHCKIYAKRLDSNGDVLDNESVFKRWNYPHLKPSPLKIHVLAEMPPKAPDYAAGEMHCHTHYSADHVEHGAPPKVLQQAAKAIGLDFVSCTDHAYDFAYLTEDYTKEADTPLTRFDMLREEIRELNKENDMPLMIAGEEVSAGNSKGENVHMTVLGPDGYLPGLGDCGRNWLENKPTLRIPKLLQMTSAHCFAAHPMQPMGYLEKFIFRRGYWSHKDLNLDAEHKIRGIQFWNGIRDEGFKLGHDWWVEELGKGNYLLPIGGNDAHGDLNDTTSVSLPLFSLRHSREHVFGKVRTVVKLGPSVILSYTTLGTKSLSGRYPPCGEDRQVGVEGSKKILSLKSLNEAFAGDNCYITDGPALWWERSEKKITFHARNTKDFGGAFRYIRIYGRHRNNSGKLAAQESLCMESLVAAPANTDISVNIDDFAYLRAECETATGHFAMTSAAVI